MIRIIEQKHRTGKPRHAKIVQTLLKLCPRFANKKSFYKILRRNAIILLFSINIEKVTEKLFYENVFRIL